MSKMTSEKLRQWGAFQPLGLRMDLEDAASAWDADRDFCEVCFTSSWDPCPEGTRNAVPDRFGGWRVCGMCAAQTHIEALETAAILVRGYYGAESNAALSALEAALAAKEKKS